jgi:hypothetical protein
MCRNDHSSRAVQPNVVCLSVISKPQQGGGLGPREPPSSEKTIRIIKYIIIRNNNNNNIHIGDN